MVRMRIWMLVHMGVLMLMFMRVFVVAFHDGLLLIYDFKIQLQVELFHINLYDSHCIGSYD